jgi:hypothetical protein
MGKKAGNELSIYAFKYIYKYIYISQIHIPLQPIKLLRVYYKQ